MNRPLCVLVLAVPHFVLAPLPMHAQEVGSLLTRIKAVGREGVGNVEAAKAWKELVKAGPSVLPQVLAGLNDADPTAANWIRAAAEVIAEQAITSGKGLQADKLEAFVKDAKNAGAARRLAFEQLSRVDPSAPDRLLPGMANDPGQELRREAVGRLLTDAKKEFDNKNNEKATLAYRRILDVARDQDQVKLAAGQLEKLGVKIDLTKHFGFITHWQLAGFFTNVKGVGFHTAYSPEKGVNLKDVYEGKGQAKVTWQETETTKPMGVVDLNKLFVDADKGRVREAVVYGYTVVEAAKEQPVEIRCGSNNAIRIYLNGKEVFKREEYHHGMEMDQHVGKATLQAGKNEILIKVCQNEQDESWAQSWSFQLRVTDHLGSPIPMKVLTGKN